MQINITGLISVTIFTIIIIGSCGDKNDITPSQELFYPNPNLKVKGLKGLDLQDPKIHSTDCLFQQIGDTAIYFFFDSSGEREKITSISWEITLEQKDYKEEIKKLLDGVYVLCEIDIDNLEIYHSEKYARIWVMNTKNNFVFRCDLLKENEKVKFYVHYDYPLLSQ